MENLSVKTNYSNMSKTKKEELIKSLKETKGLVDFSSGLGDPTVSTAGVFPRADLGRVAEVDGVFHLYDGTKWVKQPNLLEEHLFERITKEIEADENIAVGFYLRHLATKVSEIKNVSKKNNAIQYLEASKRKIVEELNLLKNLLDNL